ncbi:MAG: phospho-sugar mutase [Tissierellales bacterium]|jgi:phosphoglucomutase|nr:phospho-sugar mutase [Tissierellales bacterium]
MYKERYDFWLNNDFFDEETRIELRGISKDEKEIEDRFYKELEFGTAGLRGKIGAGTNRMNKYIVARATQGLAELICSKGKEAMNRGVAIAYDCRHYSDVFAETAALVLNANGIKSYLFDELRPTPELSFAVRRLNAISGIVVTASHNPQEYNGYKVYWEEGAQILPDTADAITENILKIKDFSKIPIMEKEEAIEKGLLNIIGKEIDDEYIDRTKALSLRDAEIDKSLKIVYTPLNGTGNKPVRRILKERGFENVYVVKEQEMPDPDFTTVGYPNPEDVKAFKLAEEFGSEIGADILIATDPDCDRLAVEVKIDNGYKALNGNQTGAILVNYVLEANQEKGTLPSNAAIVKSIVTGDLSTAICDSYGVKMFEALTGFKNIFAYANIWDSTKEYKFMFGYEESIGFCVGDLVRDKDAVNSAMFLAEAAAYYRTKGKTLLDVLDDLYEKHGYYRENLVSLVLEGIEGAERIKRMMESYRKDYPIQIEDMNLVRYVDFRTSDDVDVKNNERRLTDIPKTNAVKYYLDDGSWYAVRPSGTEPKIKIYMYSKADDLVKAEEKLKQIETTVMDKLYSIE